MALQVWIPGITGTLLNQGVFKLPNPSYNNMTEFTLGKLGKAIKGNTIYHLSNDPFINNWSISCWIKFISGYSQYNNIILCLNNSGSEDSKFYLSIINNTTLNIGRGSSGSLSYAPSGGFIVDTWYHLTATYNGTTTSLYLNGSLVNSGNVGSTKSALNLGICCRSSNENGTSATGSIFPINDIRIYDHCLNPQEVKLISQGLILHYTLDGNSFGNENIVTNMPNNWTSLNTKANFSIISYSTTNYGLSVGDIFTFSVDVNVPTDQKTLKARVQFWNSSSDRTGPTGTISISNGTGRIYVTGTVLGGYTRMELLIDYNSSIDITTTNITCYYKNVKLERGNTMTPWMPAKTDSDYISQYDNIYDSSGYQNNGTITGNLSINSDTPRFKYSTLFSSTASNYIRVPYQGLQGSYSNKVWTICFWINTQQQGNRHMITGMVSNYNTNIELLTSNGLRIYWAGTPDWSPGITCTLNTWIHIAVVITSTYIKAYKNGVLVGTNNTAPNWAGCTTDFLIGSDQRIGTYFLGAKLSDFRIYCTELSINDIKDLYDTAAYMTDSGSILTYYYNSYITNIIFTEDRGIFSKQWLRGLNKYIQSNCSCTLTDTGYRIYRTPNVNPTDNGNTMWGGFVLKNNNNQFGFIKGHTYILMFDIKGQSTNSATDIGWYNMVGWSPSNSGLLPTPSDVQITNPITANFNSSEWKQFIYKWTINDDVYKVCTNAYHSSYVVGNSYVSYLDFKFGFTYTNTGSLGTDLYIRNIRMYDITNQTNFDINKQGVLKTDILYEDKVNSFAEANIDTEKVKIGTNYITSKEFKEL